MTVVPGSGSCERGFFVKYMRHFFEDMLAIANKAGVYMSESTAVQTALQSPHSVLTVKFSEWTLLGIFTSNYHSDERIKTQYSYALRSLPWLFLLLILLKRLYMNNGLHSLQC